MKLDQPSLASLIRGAPEGEADLEAADLALVKKRPLHIRYLPSPSDAVCIVALNRNPDVIEAIHFPSLTTLTHAFKRAPGLVLLDAQVPSYWKDSLKVDKVFNIFSPDVLDAIEPGLGELVARIRSLTDNIDERVCLLQSARKGACAEELPTLDL